ncbi:hypothetical protein [Enterococcus cecorum]|uniref:hypothetical protein n=1 Tax=Enterococcus cecorum TaxID=44008 RepID=UPI000643DEDF|nr:hypothetical protein [Enterococcus cecorum]KLO73199.1 hypothetical protein AA989_08360 [Enterococcus cecorum]
MNGLMTISTISNYRVLLEEVFEEFVQEYQLDHGGAWIEFDIENNAFCIFEAPKQLKVRFMFELYDFILDYPEEFKKYLRPSQYIKQLQEDKAYLIQIYHEIVGQ